MVVMNSSYALRAIQERFESTDELISLFKDSNYKKVFNGRRAAGAKVFADMLDTLNFPKTTIIDSKLNKLPMNLANLIDRLKKLIQNKDITTAMNLFSQIEKKENTSVLVKQELLALKAQLWILERKPDVEVLRIIDEGLRITFFDLEKNSSNKTLLLMYEPELIYSKSLLMANSGKLDEAIELLYLLEKNLSLMSKADKNVRKLLCQVYIGLCSNLYKTGQHESVLKFADMGSAVSVSSSSGRYVPDFELFVANAKLKLFENPIICKIHLLHAYSGYLLLGEISNAENVLKNAQDNFGLKLELFGMNKLYSIVAQPLKILSRGISVVCNNIAEMIDMLCVERNVNPVSIYEGIISRQAYLKALNGYSVFNYFIAEAMGQRLGVDISIYNNYMLRANEYEMLELRNDIFNRYVKQNFTGVNELLIKLKKLFNKRKIVPLEQFVDFIEASFMYKEKK